MDAQSTIATSAAFYAELRKLLPDLPLRCTRIVIKLELNAAVQIEADFFSRFEGLSALELPAVESRKWNLVPVVSAEAQQNPVEVEK